MLPSRISYKEGAAEGCDVAGVLVSDNNAPLVKIMCQGETKPFIQIDPFDITKITLDREGKEPAIHRLSVKLNTDAMPSPTLYFTDALTSVVWYKWLVECRGDVEWLTEEEAKRRDQR